MADEPYAGRIEDGAHLLPIRVYYEDTDASGIVYHANYLRYFERGRTDLVRLAGVSHSELHSREVPLVFVVRRIGIEYLKPARIDDALVVRSSLARFEGPKMVVRQQVERSVKVLARGEVEIVFVRGDGRPARPPSDVAERLRAVFKPAS
ncbi:MAG TPA: tol-pal system-associated acyl-CoA thioesterase [Caulobacteraceae bacterium]|jgi:acyl-CoA thioester hydrolase